MLRARETQPALAREVERYMDEHWPNYKAGYLLTDGGTADQPARYLAFMTLIQSVRAKQEAKFEEITRPPEPAAPPPAGA